jgi:hypothetical protein
MFRHPFESEWNQERHEREVNEWVRHRQFIRGHAPQHRIRRLVGKSIVSVGVHVGRSLVSVGNRLATEPARGVARPR